MITLIAMKLLRVREIDTALGRLERLVDRRKPRRGTDPLTYASDWGGSGFAVCGEVWQ